MSNTIQLGRIISISKGKKHNLQEDASSNSKRYIQIEDLRSDKTLKYTDDEKGVFVTQDDIIIAWDGANAATVGYNLTGFIGSTLAALRNNNPKEYNPQYLALFLQSKFNYLRSRTTGATIPHLHRKTLENLKVPKLKIDDQIHIANLLSQVESLIAKREESIRLLDELLKSTFLDMFGDPRTSNKQWKIVKLGILGNWKSGGTPLRKELQYYEGDIPWISSGELNEMFISSSKEHITFDAIMNSNAKEIEIGSLLLGMYDTAALKSSITTITATCNQAIAFAKLDDTQCNIFYIYHLIQIGKEYFKRQQRGVRQQNMNITMIKNMPIILPPKPLQDKFATIVQQVEQTKEQHQKSLQELKNLFGSLSQRAFRGELE